MYNKGVTTIEFFDVNGEKVQEYREENLVTNAVDNILNGAMKAQIKCKAKQKDSEGIFNNLSNIPHNMASDYYGGLMVFSEPIEENKNHCIPSNIEMDSYIGGGSILPCDAVDTYHSTFVEKESLLDDPDVFRVVYEFGNQQCNGTIKSICLTSAIGGRLGLKQINQSNAVDSTLEVGSNSVFDGSRPLAPTKMGNSLVNITDLQLSYSGGKVDESSLTQNSCIMKDGYILQIVGNEYLGAPIDGSEIGVFLIKYDEAALEDSLQFNSSNEKLQSFGGSSLVDVTIDNKGTLQDLKGLYTKKQAYSLTLVPTTDEDYIYELLSSSDSEVVLRKIGLEVVEGEPVVNFEEVTYNTVNLNTSCIDYLEVNYKASFPLTVSEGKLIYLVGYCKGANREENKLRLYSVDTEGIINYSDLSMSEGQQNLLCLQGFGGTGLISTKGKFYMNKFLGAYYLLLNGNDFRAADSYNKEYAPFSSYYFKVDLETMEVGTESTLAKYNCTNKEGWGDFSTSVDTYKYWEGYTDNYEIIPSIAAEPWVIGKTNRLGKLYNQTLFMSYLGTINNQSESLVKDSSKTMKITYTLTRVKEA